MSKSRSGRPVLVTTAKEGVFFGWAVDAGPDWKTDEVTARDIIRLEGCRLVVYWSPAMKGFMGLAALGPDGECRIGPEADITLRNVTACVEVTAPAVKRFDMAPWSAS